MMLHQNNHGQCKMQTADCNCRPGVNVVLGYKNAVCISPLVCNLHFTLSLCFTPSLQSAIRIQCFTLAAEKVWIGSGVLVEKLIYFVKSIGIAWSHFSSHCDPISLFVKLLENEKQLRIEPSRVGGVALPC